MFRLLRHVAFARHASPFQLRPGRPAVAIVIAALMQGCAAAPPSPATGNDPSDPSTRTKAVHYRSGIATYERQLPVEPASWQEQNQRVTPAPKP